MLSAGLAGCVDGSSVVSSQAPSHPVSSDPAASAVSQARLDAYFAKVTKLRGEGKRSIRKANVRAALAHVDWTRPDWRWDAGAAAENRVANIELSIAAKMRRIVPPAPLADAHARYANGWRLWGLADRLTAWFLGGHRLHFDTRRIDRREGAAQTPLKAYHRMVISYAKAHRLKLPHWMYERWSGPLSLL
jgi:hypothetical protein